MSIPSQLHLFSRTILVSQNVCRQRTRRKSYPLNCQELAFLPLLQVQKWNRKSLMTTSPVWQTEKKCNWQTVINWKFGIQRSNKALPISMRSTSKIKNSANVVSKSSLLFFVVLFVRDLILCWYSITFLVAGKSRLRETFLRHPVRFFSKN